MAYLRGDTYIWNDESGFHFWAKDGYDNWDIAGWSTDQTGENREEGFENASGVSIHEEIIDVFVMMRLAQLIDQGKVAEVIDRACDELGGNFGSLMLKRNATKLKNVLTQIEMDDQDA